MHFYTSVIQEKGQILVRGYKNGKRYSERDRSYKPYLFVPSQEPEGYKTIDGKNVAKMTFDSVWEARKFYFQYKDVDNFPVYGSNRFEYTYIYDKFKNVKFDLNLIKTLVIDIEVSMENGPPDFDSADKPITAITMMYKDITFALGMGDYTPENDTIKYIKCDDETDLLEKFIKIWSSDAFMPDVVTGWNTNTFDIPYIINRLIQVLGEDEAKKLSPWRILKPRTFETFGRTVQAFDVMGINCLDYLELYKKFILKPRERYSLDYISSVELEERKTDYSEYGTLNELYKQNHQLFMEYNVRDCLLVKRLDDKLKLLALVYEFAYDSGLNYIDAMTSVRSWDVIIHNYLMDKHIVVPKQKYLNENTGVIGAHVKSPIVGMHPWVVSFDLASLYPSLIMSYNISPDTFRGMMNLPWDHEGKVEQWLQDMPDEYASKLDAHNLSMAANGATFTKDKQGFLSVLMEALFEKRKVYKKKMLDAKKKYERTKDESLKNDISKYDNLQLAAKVKLNSAYGALANAGFRFYDRRFAEAITLSGQLTIRWAETNLNRFINDQLGTGDRDYIIASDTDSLYINMDGIVKASRLTDTKEIVDYLDKFCNEVMQPVLDKAYSELAERMRCHKQALYMKRESISERGIFLAKKRYALKMWDNEGVRYSPAELKMMGVEAIRSSTPTACREAIKETLDLILNKDEATVQAYIADFHKKFMSLPFEEIARNSSLSELDDYDDGDGGRKGTPNHVKGAILYNNLLKKHKLNGKYNMIYRKDKIKYHYLKEPNPTFVNVIATPGPLPEQFGLEKFLDKNKQFDKTYLEPIKGIMEKIGWEHEKRTKITSFFG